MELTPEFISEIKIDKEEKGNIKINDKNYPQIIKDYSIGLTCYESICKPRMINNESNININQDQINKIIEEIFRCSICYNILNNPVSIKGCLHKFCKNCISDYYFKTKKGCAICRHSIETKRLLKEDTKIKNIIDCFIPDLQLFKEEEDKIISQKAKCCIFKDDLRHKNQIQKMKNEDYKDYNNSIFKNESGIKNHILNKKTNRSNHVSQKSSINDEVQNSEIIVRILCDEKDSELKQYFKYTRMKVEKSNTLEFISRFICYKQNFKFDQIKKINFYTLENDAKKKEWNQNDKLSDVVKYDSKKAKSPNQLEEDIKESFYSHLYHLYLYFYIN